VSRKKPKLSNKIDAHTVVNNNTAVAKRVVVKTDSKQKNQKSSHPSFFEMISEALKSLNERNGSSRQALLKFIISNYKVDGKTGNQHLKLALKNAVKAGTLKQMKGIGASGSFKLVNTSVAKKVLAAKKKKSSLTKAAMLVTVKKKESKKTVDTKNNLSKSVNSVTKKQKTVLKKKRPVKNKMPLAQMVQTRRKKIVKKTAKKSKVIKKSSAITKTKFNRGKKSTLK
jgi:histone H1/5